MKISRFIKRYRNELIIVLIIVLLFGFMPKYLENFESNMSSFDDDIASGKKLVWFYAPWCGHCKTMHKAWDSASKVVNSNKNNMIKLNIGDSKNKQHQAIASKYKVQGFPTILLLHNGETSAEYNGDRTKSAFVKYCKENGIS